MMPKQLPNVMNDIGYQKDAHDLQRKLWSAREYLVHVRI